MKRKKKIQKIGIKETLRLCDEVSKPIHCRKCPYYERSDCMLAVMRDAADLIEELEAK